MLNILSFTTCIGIWSLINVLILVIGNNGKFLHNFSATDSKVIPYISSMSFWCRLRIDFFKYNFQVLKKLKKIHWGYTMPQKFYNKIFFCVGESSSHIVHLLPTSLRRSCLKLSDQTKNLIGTITRLQASWKHSKAHLHTSP